MKLSVVVPVHNGGADLRACLQAIAQSSRRADEIVVVDDGSTDGASAVASEFSARVIPVPGGPRGPAFARNRGAEQAKGDVLVFVDADVQVHAGTLGGFERALGEEPSLAAAFGSYDDQPSAPGPVSRFKNLLHHYVHQHGAREAETFWAGCGAIRREVFVKAGGFSEGYPRPSIEDIELGGRLRGAGHRIGLRPEILCTHRKRWTLASLLCTDIFARAIPWTRLILRQGQLPSGLNTDGKSRWSAALVGVLALALLVSSAEAAVGQFALSVAAAGLFLGSGLALGALNHRLYRFFFAHGGLRFGVTTLGLHWLYLLYSSVVFASMLAFYRLTGGAGAPTDSRESRAHRQPIPSLRKHLAGGILFATLFAIYVGNGDPLPGNDATPNVHLAVNLLARGTLVYTPENDPSFFHWTLVRGGAVKPARVRSWDELLDGRTMRELRDQGMLRLPVAPYYLSRTTKPGVYVSSYGAATGLFALPFVAAVYPFVNDLPKRSDLLWLLAKLAASFAVAGSAWFLFLVGAEYLRLSTAVVLTLIYGLATSAWSVSSQALWQHGPGEFFLALGMFCLFRANAKTSSEGLSSSKSGSAPYAAGLAFSLAFMCRPTNSVAVLAGLIVLLADRRAALRYLVAGVAVATLFFAYNLHYFDRLIAFGQVTSLAERANAGGALALWKHSFTSGLAGVLLSPSRGLFVYSPIFIVSAWAAFHIWRERRWLPLRAAAIAAAGIWLVSAGWSGWWGGWCYGYRLVVDSAILLAFLAIPVAEKIRHRRGLTVLLGVLVLWSVGVQTVGAFVYDVSGWNGREGYTTANAGGTTMSASFTTPEDAAAFCQTRGCSYGPAIMDVDQWRFRARLWSLRDSQILYYLQNLRKSRLHRAEALQHFLGGGV